MSYEPIDYDPDCLGEFYFPMDEEEEEAFVVQQQDVATFESQVDPR